MSEQRLRWSRRHWILIGLVIAIPLGFLGLAKAFPPDPIPVHQSPVSHFPSSSIAFTARGIGPEPGLRPRITSVKIADLDRDGQVDIVVGDAERNRVLWYRSLGNGQWDERPIGRELPAPVISTPVDMDGDGDLDIPVAVLDSILPTDERVGRVVWLENKGETFETHTVLENVRRVADVQAADLDGDGDVDLAVAVFGYNHGEILWLENRSAKFYDHHLLTTDGPSHVPIADFNGDGRLDIAALVSQEHEEVWLFENRGGGTFAPRRIFHSLNFDLGSVGLVATDLDNDQRMDFLLVAGDNLEVNHHFPQPWHGCIWLVNRGDGTFEPRRVGSVGGVYGLAVADFHGDGHKDIVLACMFNDWNREGAASLVLLENDGRNNFTAKKIADRPIYLAAVAAGDINGDGRPDIVAGSLNLYTPTSGRVGRLTAWIQPTEGHR